MSVKFVALLVFASVGGYLLFFYSGEPAEMTEELATASEYGIGNNAVYMAGCQTYPKPVPLKKIYPTVRKNFVTLPCALEVPPPGGALEFGKYFVVK